MNDDGYIFFLIVILPIVTPLVAYLIGSIPSAYLIVRGVTGEDIAAHGTGNVGAMNVKRTTGSWGWFAVAMVADAAKGLLPTLAAKLAVSSTTLDWAAAFRPWSDTLRPIFISNTPTLADWRGLLLLAIPMLAVFGSVLGHNYSLWLAFKNRRLSRTGKGLATGGGALLAYDWRYLAVALAVALVMIAITRYLMAGQVAAAISLPVFAAATRQPDWPFAMLMGLVVYAAHHKRFVGMLVGEEPKLYVKDAMGPRG